MIYEILVSYCVKIIIFNNDDPWFFFNQFLQLGAFFFSKTQNKHIFFNGEF